ncbi:hypothetical protein [Chitinophaga pinensis]|uniref:Uncharacterized protein n=1 Tax=Chitinophaga pinensis TaxID=79329 RepID=A0A5C6LLP0_9BACT|nr:hypothetical protein [Chitinophaga pinensis]TWV95673.1 hypothetical protein FEF09_24225 [Chitinophaga pinensis]
MTREELKEARYKLLYEQESARQDLFSQIIRRKPIIDSTADIAGEDYEAIRADVNTSKLFLQSSTFDNNLMLGILVSCVMTACFLFQALRDDRVNFREGWLPYLCVCLTLVIVLRNVKMLLSKTRLEINVTGILHNDRMYTWENLLDTYIVTGRGRKAEYLLVLLMDDGEIVRITLNKFHSLQYNPALDISYYIEHYKQLRDRTVLAG